jgi:fatty acid desaturase
MPVVKTLRPDRLFSAELWAGLTHVSRWRGAWLVTHAWAVTAAIIGAATWAAHPAAWIAAVILVGGRQLGLAILMHEAAHGLLHPNRRINNLLGQWLTGAAVGSDLPAYRAYHLRHHKFTQQAEDPDLPLSAPFPTSRKSLLRKALRDLTGQTFFKQRLAQFVMAFRALPAMLRNDNTAQMRADTRAGTPFNRPSTAGTSLTSGNGAATSVARSAARFLLIQGALLALSLAVYGWTPFLIWLAALATTFQLYLRLRNIAEHACTSVGSDDPFTHARTTRAGWFERATVAPYWVNYHAEHHLFMGVPCYQLGKVHRLLGELGRHRGMTIAPSYRAVLREVTASQPA